MSELPIEGFTAVRMTFRGKTRTVLVSSQAGRPVILLHELYGITPRLVEFARMIVGAGFRIYMPILFGTSEPVDSRLGKAKRAAEFACVVRQFKLLSANQSGPWTDWLCDLVGRACDDSHAPGAGVIGLCLTGNFALSTAMDRRVLAPILGEPSLGGSAGGLHVTPKELSEVKRRTVEEGLIVRGYRYSTDVLCPASRFTRLRTELGEAFEGVTIEVDEKLHSVFTEHLRDANGQLRHNKVADVIQFLDSRL